MLLTRSPLSPGPKPWFSLDLHVLSAPPAFVLSQDQTLREELLSAELRASLASPVRQLVHLELELKGLPRRADGFMPPALRPKVSTFHAVEFSKTAPLGLDCEKKPPVAPEAHLFPSSTDVSDLGSMDSGGCW